MILYTPLHESEIFEDEEDYDQFYWINVKHSTLKLKRNIDTHSYEIVYMCSTDPSDYLNPQLQPGAKIYL